MPVCAKSITGSGNMQKLQGEYTGKGVVWLTIDSNAPGLRETCLPEQAQKVMKDWNTKQTALLLDPARPAGRIYTRATLHTMFVINPEAKLIYEGDDRQQASPNPA